MAIYTKSQVIAYLDESGFHAQAEIITISGIVARSEQWELLSRLWPSAMGSFPLPYHHTDFLQLQKKCVDAVEAKEYDLLQERLINALSQVEYYGFGASLIRSDWDLFKNRLRDSEPYREPWLFVFESAIEEIMSRTEETFGVTAPISFVFDRQDQFAERARALYSRILSKDLPYRKRLRDDLEFRPKDDCPPLQAVDLFTYEANRYVRETRIKNAEPERWQLKRIRESRPNGAINGQVWNAHKLEELAQLKESGLETPSEPELRNRADD